MNNYEGLIDCLETVEVTHGGNVGISALYLTREADWDDNNLFDYVVEWVTEELRGVVFDLTITPDSPTGATVYWTLD